MGAPLDEATKNKLRFFLSERHMLDMSGKEIRESIWKEFSLKISIPTCIKLRDDARDAVEAVVSAKTAEVQTEVIDKVKSVNPSQYIDFLDRIIRDLEAVLYDPFYQGDIPLPQNLQERLQLQNSMVGLIEKIFGIIGPPKVQDQKNPLESKYAGKDLFGYMADLEAVFKGEYVESEISEEVQEELSKAAPA